MRKIGLACLLGVVFCACNENESVSANIGSEGGTLVSKDGKLTLEVPPGAVAEQTTFTIAKADSAAPGNVGPAYGLGPSDRSFRYPVKLSMTYDSAELKGAPPELWVAVEHKGEWFPLLSSSVDKTKQTVTAETLHFSKYSKIIAKLHKLLAAFGSDVGEKNPCLCDMDVWKTCCLQSGPLNPKVPGVWCPILSPKRCACANADSYALAECFEKKAGYEFLGCTACERKCCKAVSGSFTAWQGECSCFPYGPAEKCLKACKDNLDHLTMCELARGQLDVKLATLNGEDKKGFCRLLNQILQGKNTSSCAPALTALLKGCETLDLSTCTLSTKALVACAVVIAKTGCPGPAACTLSCSALNPSGSDLGLHDARTDEDQGAKDYMTAGDAPVSPVSSDLIAIWWNDSIKKEEFGVLDSKTGKFSLLGYVGDLAMWSGQHAIVGTTLYVVGSAGSSGSSPWKLYALNLSTGKLIGSSVLGTNISFSLAGHDTKKNLIAFRYSNQKYAFGVLDPPTGKFSVLGDAGLAVWTNQHTIIGDTLFVTGKPTQDPTGTLPFKLLSFSLSTGKLIGSAALGTNISFALAGADIKGNLIAFRSAGQKHEFGVLDPQTGKFSFIGDAGLVSWTNQHTTSGDTLLVIGKTTPDPSGTLPFKLLSFSLSTGKLIGSAVLSTIYHLAGAKP